MCNIRLLILVIIIISCHLIGCLWGMPRIHNNLKEGDQCILENGDRGVGEVLSECPSSLKDVQDKERTSDSIGRYEFDNFTEIVCCPVNVRQKIVSRPVEVVCEKIRRRHLIEYLLRKPVFGGRIVELHRNYSYMVALRYKNEKTGENARPIKYSCGGSLISSQHVLTAAHCVNNIDGDVPVEVWMGSVNLLGLEGISILISDIISHPRYRRSKNYNDVAILKLMSRVPASATIIPICMETKSVATVSITPNTSLVVLGWGATAFGDNIPSPWLIKSPSLSLVNNEECNKSYTDFTRKLPHGIDDSLICVVDANTSRKSGACRGDSGGPLVMSTELGEHRLIGITAFGIDCGGVDPGVNTAVYPFLEWIEEHVWPTTDRNDEDMF